jgi:hypothetical protein
MIFDRSAITVGRTILDFGLCDTKGVYQTTTKLRTRGWLVVAFIDPVDSNSAKAAEALSGWSDLPQDKVTILTVSLADPKSPKVSGLSLPGIVVWDFDAYVAGIWGVNAVPTIFVANGAGKVLAKMHGFSAEELSGAKALLSVDIKNTEDAAQAAAATAPARP